MVSAKIPWELIVNPNSAAVNCTVNPDAVYGLPDDVTVSEKKDIEDI